MSVIDSLTVEVNAKISVDQKTAEACLKLVEIFMNNHCDCCIQVARNEDGTETFTIIRRDGYVREQQSDPATEGS